MSWHVLKFAGNVNLEQEINLKLTLSCGQAFRWRYHKGEWICGFDRFIARLRQNADNSVQFYCNNNSEITFITDILRDYFRCDDILLSKMNYWNRDAIFKSVTKDFQGIRLLRLDPTENLFSFICSSNNHITRISKLVCLLTDEFGVRQSFRDVDDKEVYCSAFPSVLELCRIEGLETRLRTLKFGYRAKFIAETAAKLGQRGQLELISLRELPYGDAKKFLLTLPGVGSKIADCVLLGSMDKTNSVPVDVHMLSVCQKYYGSLLPAQAVVAKSLSSSVYQTVQRTLASQWGDECGWAQLVMFAADLKNLQTPKSPPMKASRALKKD